MLTNEEREWVRENQTRNGCIYARRCRYTCFEPPYCPVIPTKEDLAEAADFEARVAAKLADAYWPPLVYTPVAPFEQLFMPPADRLKWARIKVEEEMDADLRRTEPHTDTRT